MAEFEVLLISIDWECPHKVRSITPSKKYLEVSTISGNRYEYDIVLYNKEDGLFFQFAIKTTHTPVLKKHEGNRELNNELCNVKDDLWIIKGDWRIGQRRIGYHHCPSINTIGKIEIEILDDHQEIQHTIIIDINSNIDDFDFAQLKTDFEGELWNLITSDKSNLKSDKIEIRYCDKIFRYPENQSIIEFLKAFDHIEKNPKRELAPTKEFRKREKVIPIAETYRKLSTAGAATLLPSKAVLENYDIYENRFVCFMLRSIHLIVSKNIKYTSQQIERSKNEIKAISQKITELQAPDPKVAPEEIEQEISFQEQRVQKLTERWKNISLNFPKCTTGTCERIEITIKYLQSDTENVFWCSTNTVGFCLFEFPDCVLSYISEGEKFHFVAIVKDKGSISVQSGKSYPRYKMTSVEKIWSEELNAEINILKKQKKNKSILEVNNWRQFSILSDIERKKIIEERDNQIQTLTRRIEKINIQIEDIRKFNSEQSQLHPLLEKRLKTNFFKKVSWKSFQRFNPSMTFIQNIAYRNALRYYKDILESEGIDIEIFDLYENVISFGLREMPQVYELWCLVTQIRVLEESFHFTHNSRDLSMLLKSINPQKKNISEYLKIDFNNRLADRQVTLHYQKSIADNKRPDFILEISCNGRTINLILDAKFKNYHYKKSIISETFDMVNKYGCDENYVFVLHPCKNGIYEDRTIKYTNHGGERIFYGKTEELIKFPFHRYGYIELKPNFTDALKKLFAMSFEYLLEPSRNAKQEKSIDPKPTNKMFCINCGKDNISITSQKRGDNRHYYICTCNETNCGHEIYIDYCWNCQTKLFKHGSYWDYHLESTWSIFDIRCPNCGMTVADRPQTKYLNSQL